MANNSHIDQVIGQRATRWGHIDHRELRRLGLSHSAISVRCKTGKLVRVFHGVYAVGHVQRTATARADAAVLACGQRTALSHDSAAALFGLRDWPRVPEVSSPRRFRIAGIRAHRTNTLTLADVTVRSGIPVTTIARTTADIAPRLTDIQLTNLIHEARRNRHLPNTELARLYRLCPRAAGAYNSEEAPSRSIFQHEFKQFLLDWDLPVPEFEALWHGYQVDAFYEDHKLIVELDGYLDHSEPDRFEADRERDALAIQLRFDTLRITWARLKRRPAPLARQLRAILADRDPTRA